MALNFPARNPAAPAAPKASTPPARTTTPAPAVRAGRSLFAGVEDVKASFQSNYIAEGNYIVLIRNIKTISNRKGDDFVAIEMTVLACLPGIEPMNRPGEEVSHLIGAKNDSFLPNVKAMIAGLAGKSADEVTEETCMEVAPEGNDAVSPLSGMIAEVSAKGITTKKGTPFTVVSYKGAVSATQLARVSSDENAHAIEMALGAGVLEKLVAAESGEAAS